MWPVPSRRTSRRTSRRISRRVAAVRLASPSHRPIPRMPELPEVEAAVRVLRAAAVGRIIRQALTRHASARRALPDDVAAALVGRRITAVARLGKHQAMTLDDGSTL